MADMQKNADATIAPAESQQPPVSDQVAPAAAAVTAEPNVQADAVPVVTPAPEVAKKVTPAVAIAPVQAEQEQPSFLASLLESVNLFVLGGAGVLVLLGAGWVYLRNKRRRDLDSFERGILTSGGLRANTVFGNTTGNATSSADTSFLTDFAQSADGGMIDTNDVDPIAEAEVYMAYGRDAQAEEILKDAISKEPKRYELHLKLLEMYAARKDASAFETIAGELYTTLGADDPTWAKVAELGITVEPDNPLYDISQITASVPVAKAVVASSDSVVADMDLGNDLDFSFDKAKSVSEVDSDANASLDMQSSLPSHNELDQVNSEKESFDLGGLNSEFSANTTEDSTVSANTGSLETTAADSKPAADNSMDFDFPELGSFSLGTDETASANEQPSLNVADQQDSTPVFELPASTANDEIVFTAAAPAEESSALASLDFNFNTAPDVDAAEAPAVSNDFNFEGFADAVTPVEEVKAGSGALDSTDFNFEDFGEPAAALNEEKTEVNALEGISLDFGAEDSSNTVADNQRSEEISFDFPLVDEPESLALNKDDGGSNQNEANNFDFSAISLDLSDSQPQITEASQAATDMPVAEFVTEPVVENENPDIDIKLDLVKVYIDMEDLEGARDLLDEVLKEGGPQQRSTAEKLLASLA
jgi:pilus assembly protein FimV